MALYRLTLRVAMAFGVVSALAGLAGLVYWLGASGASVFVVVASGLLLASGGATAASSLILESAEDEIGRLRGREEQLSRERDVLLSECDASRSRVRRLERRAESLSIVREIHRSTNIITRSERLRQILAVIGQLAEDVEATLFAQRERVAGETDPANRLRPVAYHLSRNSDGLFIRFDRAYSPGARIGIASAVATTNGQRREISGDLVAGDEPVGRIEATITSSDGFGVAADASPEDVLAWVLGGVDLDCLRPCEAIERGRVIRSHDRSSDEIEFLYPLTAEGEMVGAFRLRIPRRDFGDAGSGIATGGLNELDEVLAECARHVALALKKEADADRAITDGLTGLLLKREFEPRLAEALDEAATERRPVSLLVVDIDHFKKVNDSHGHRTGDLILRGVAGLVRRHIRARDSAYRYGGEELCLVLPGTGAREARAIAERLRESVEAARFTSEVGQELGVTISLGLATFDSRRSSSAGQADEGEVVDTAEFFRRADAAVYRAKDTGRNRVVAWTKRMRKTRKRAASSGQRRGPYRVQSVKRTRATSGAKKSRKKTSGTADRTVTCSEGRGSGRRGKTRRKAGTPASASAATMRKSA